MTEPISSDATETLTTPPKRGAGRGGNFFVLDRNQWADLWQVPTVNRLNLVTAFLVLSAGTGADHRLTKWSAKACEERAGMGKPRAKVAIDELIENKLAERTTASTAAFPQYRMAEHTSPDEPIFLPVALVTGLSSETPVLRRIRETGDAMLLRMLVDLYGLVQIDAANGIPIGHLTQFDQTEHASQKIAEAGANTVWALHLGTHPLARGEWCAPHMQRKEHKQDWSHFWDRLDKLKVLGALWYEPWIFNSSAEDAEPLFPVASLEGDRSAEAERDVKNLTFLASETAEALCGERKYLIEQHSDCDLIVMPTHHQPPFIRGVAKPRIEADTPGRRLAYAQRKNAIEQYTAACAQVFELTKQGQFNRPVQLPK